MRDAIVRHLLQNDDLFVGSTQVGVNLRDHSLSEYIDTSGMANNKQWDTEVELFAISHLLRTKLYNNSRDGKTWQVHSSSDIDPILQAVLIWECIFTLHMIIT